MSARIASVIVSYDPPPGFAGRLRAALAQTDFAVVVDNASGQPPETEAPLRERVHLLRNDRNLGLAAALNRGVEHAAAQGADYALLLDHDSTPDPGMAEALLAAYREGASEQPLAAAVPCIAYGHPAIACRWPRSNGRRSPFFRFVYARTLDAPAAVDLAIGSGMLVRIDTFRALGGFDEALFIDLVDTDYCLRARAAGHVIAAVPGAVLRHQLGDVEQRRLLGLPVYPTHHSAARHYTIARNRVRLARRHARRFPAWMVYELLGAVKLTVKVALFEPGRGGKLRSMLRGTRDGWRS